MLRRSQSCGFGLYPGDPCFMQDRPGWLPYWWDTNGEAKCQERSGRDPETGLNRPPAPAAPQTRAEMPVWTPADVDAAAPSDWERWKAANRATIQEPGGVLSVVENVFGPPGDEADWFERNKWFVLAGGLGLTALVLATARR